MKQSNSTAVSSVSDGANQAHQKAQIIKKVCVWEGNINSWHLLRQQKMLWLPVALYIVHSAPMSEQIPVYRMAQND